MVYGSYVCSGWPGIPVWAAASGKGEKPGKPVGEQRRFTLEVTRNLEDRSQNLPEHSPLERELHRRRATALHDVFDHAKAGLSVVEWGATDDSEPHEIVTLTIAAFVARHLPVAATAIAGLGAFLAGKVVDAATSHVIDVIISRLILKQQAHDIADYTIATPDGTRLQVAVPEGANVRIRVWIAGGAGSEATLNYTPKP